MKKKNTKAFKYVCFTVFYIAMAVITLVLLRNLYAIDVNADDEKFSAIERLNPDDKDEALLIAQGLALKEWSEQIKKKVTVMKVFGVLFELLLIVGVVGNAKAAKKALREKEESELKETVA